MCYAGAEEKSASEYQEQIKELKIENGRLKIENAKLDKKLKTLEKGAANNKRREIKLERLHIGSLFSIEIVKGKAYEGFYYYRLSKIVSRAVRIIVTIGIDTYNVIFFFLFLLSMSSGVIQ